MTYDTQHIFSDERVFESFFKDHYSIFCRFAYGFTNDSDDAEEIVQNTFVKFWESRKTMVIGNNPKPYLFTMIRNACLNQIKHISIREEYKSHNEREILNQQTEEETDQENLQDKIQIAIEKMPPQRRKIFEMSRFEGLKYREIAAHLNISIKTVENHMGSAMKDLRVEFKDYLHLAFIIYLIEGLGENVNSIVLLLAS
ncbi:MAG: RNA polymerase sigma-70 factor [Salibacteraceae bacterium]